MNRAKILFVIVTVICLTMIGIGKHTGSDVLTGLGLFLLVLDGIGLLFRYATVST